MYAKITTTTLLLTLALAGCNKDAEPTTTPDEATVAPDGSTAPDESNEPSEEADVGASEEVEDAP